MKTYPVCYLLHCFFYDSSLKSKLYLFVFHFFEQELIRWINVVYLLSYRLPLVESTQTSLFLESFSRQHALHKIENTLRNLKFQQTGDFIDVLDIGHYY